MKILAIADRTPDNLKETLANNNFDLIITLGDLDYFSIKELEFTDTPKIGVYGNHCTRGYMDMLGIQDLHLKTFEINGVTFGGFEGCVRYKNGNHFMYTQEEAWELIKELEKVDVLICHCPPKGINDNEDPAHYGFEALRDYVDKFSPKALFHGHTYDFGNFVTKYENTEVFYIEKGKILNLNF